jgi:hypothetical protein
VARCYFCTLPATRSILLATHCEYSIRVHQSYILWAENGRPPPFVVDGIKIIHNQGAGEPPKIRLTSDLPEGPYTVDFPPDAVVTMIVEPRDDDT